MHGSEPSLFEGTMKRAKIHASDLKNLLFLSIHFVRRSAIVGGHTEKRSEGSGRLRFIMASRIRGSASNRKHTCMCVSRSVFRMQYIYTKAAHTWARKQARAVRVRVPESARGHAGVSLWMSGEIGRNLSRVRNLRVREFRTYVRLPVRSNARPFCSVVELAIFTLTINKIE